MKYKELYKAMPNKVKNLITQYVLICEQGEKVLGELQEITHKIEGRGLSKAINQMQSDIEDTKSYLSLCKQVIELYQGKTDKDIYRERASISIIISFRYRNPPQGGRTSVKWTEQSAAQPIWKESWLHSAHAMRIVYIG